MRLVQALHAGPMPHRRRPNRPDDPSEGVADDTARGERAPKSRRRAAPQTSGTGLDAVVLSGRPRVSPGGPGPDEPGAADGW